MASIRLSERGLALIQQFEGFSSRIYKDAAGLPTIGYGHLLKPDELALYAKGIHVSRAKALLREDTILAERAVHRYIEVPLTQQQFDALVSFTFNLGSGVLQRSTLRRKVNQHLLDEVPEQFLRYVWAGGRKLRGLMLRRAAEATLFIS